MACKQMLDGTKKDLSKRSCLQQIIFSMSCSSSLWGICAGFFVFDSSMSLNQKRSEQVKVKGRPLLMFSYTRLALEVPVAKLRLESTIIKVLRRQKDWQH